MTGDSFLGGFVAFLHRGVLVVEDSASETHPG